MCSTRTDPRPASAGELPRADVEGRVIAIVSALATELGTLPARGSASLDDTLDRDLGLGSLEQVELALRLEQAFGVPLGDTLLTEAEYCRDLVTAVSSAGPPDTERGSAASTATSSASASPASVSCSSSTLSSSSRRWSPKLPV